MPAPCAACKSATSFSPRPSERATCITSLPSVSDLCLVYNNVASDHVFNLHRTALPAAHPMQCIGVSHCTVWHAQGKICTHLHDCSVCLLHERSAQTDAEKETETHPLLSGLLITATHTGQPITVSHALQTMPVCLHHRVTAMHSCFEACEPGSQPAWCCCWQPGRPCY